MQVTPISAFRANIKQYYDEVLLTEDPLIITSTAPVKTMPGQCQK